jgi:hypothetical protein
MGCARSSGVQRDLVHLGRRIGSSSNTNKRQALRSQTELPLCSLQTRLHWPNHYIWIDSICINQHALKETSVQVQNMASIYANADTVLLCVGPHSHRSHRFQEYAESLEFDHRLQMQGRGRHERGDPATSAWWIHIQGEPPNGDIWMSDEALESITAFASRPCWSRLWIIQEVAVA